MCVIKHEADISLVTAPHYNQSLHGNKWTSLVLLNPEERGACLCVCVCVRACGYFSPLDGYLGVRKRDWDSEERERREGSVCWRRREIQKERQGCQTCYVDWGQQENKQLQLCLFSPLHLSSISLYLFSSLSDLPFFSWSYSAGEFRQLVYAAALRLNRITKQEASNLSTVTVYTRRTVMLAWKRNSTSYETGLI